MTGGAEGLPPPSTANINSPTPVGSVGHPPTARPRTAAERTFAPSPEFIGCLNQLPWPSTLLHRHCLSSLRARRPNLRPRLSAAILPDPGQSGRRISGARTRPPPACLAAFAAAPRDVTAPHQNRQRIKSAATPKSAPAPLGRRRTSLQASPLSSNKGSANRRSHKHRHCAHICPSPGRLPPLLSSQH
jgi:hypothetical protein